MTAKPRSAQNQSLSLQMCCGGSQPHVADQFNEEYQYEMGKTNGLQYALWL